MSVSLLYIDNKQFEYEIKRTVPFTTAHTQKKHSGINPPKYAWDLHAKNYKRVMKETKVDPHK